MGAKLKFTDVFNNELAIGNLNFGSINTGLTVAAGVPNVSASIGTLYLDSNSGNLYRNWSGTNNWTQISSITNSIIYGHQRNVIVNAAVTSTDSSAPSVGDLVGIWGPGTWAVSGQLAFTKANLFSFGSQNAAVVAAGFSAGVNYTNSELFNGSVWTSSGNTNLSRANGGNQAGLGSQNAGMIGQGSVGGASVTTWELFNGSAWSLSANTATSNTTPAHGGTALAALSSPNAGSKTELFNGTSWSSVSNALYTASFPACGGTQMAAYNAGGNGAAALALSGFFNGSTWLFSGNMNVSRYGGMSSGSQNSCFLAGGFTGGNSTNTTEVFNGSTWTISGALGTNRFGGGGGGSQAAGIIAGGCSNSAVGADQRSTELHNQTIFRKMYARYLPTAAKIGILSATNTVLLQGSTLFQGITYPANKYLVMNRNAITQVSNELAITSITFGSVIGSGSLWTYSFSSATTVTQLVPGMFAIANSAGLNPVGANNLGMFLINRVVSPTSVELINPSGSTQNPGTGTLTFISTLIAVNNISPQDIVIGKTDGNGILVLSKPLQVGSIFKRLR